MSDRTGKIFVDTNILVYAHDIESGPKRTRAAATLEDLWNRRAGVLSLQVLQEFYVTLTQKIAKPLPSKTALDLVRQYGTWEIAKMDVEDLIEAVHLQQKHRLAFWDALIVQAALSSDCGILLSEDMAHNHRLEGLVIQNPFHD